MLMLAYFIIEKEKIKSLNMLKVFKMIMFHDLGEIEIGDITPFDNYDVAKKHKEERSAIENISKKHKIIEILELWDEYNQRKTKEAIFVKMIDHLDFVCQANETNQQELLDEIERLKQMIKEKEEDEEYLTWQREREEKRKKKQSDMEM